MRRKLLRNEISKGILATLIVFVTVELLLRVAYLTRNSTVEYIPLPYGYVLDDYGPIPPWVTDLQILDRDDILIWKNRPNLQRKYIDVFSPVHTEQERTSLLRQFIPNIPNSFRKNPVWEVSLNSEGFRDSKFPKGKSPSVFRIVCLGDSWTFGSNVGQNESYPQQLNAFLKQEYPQANFEVFNLGVLGYSSFQGLQLLRRKGTELAPNMVVIAFAMNDSKVAGYHDKDLPGMENSSTFAASSDKVLQRIESYKLLRYLALVLKYRPGSVGDHIRRIAHAAETSPDVVPSLGRMEDYEKVQKDTRVPLEDYEKNILELIDLARRKLKASVVLVYNELAPNSLYRKVLEKIAMKEGVSFVDSQRLIAEARRKIEDDLEAKLNLQPPRAEHGASSGEVEVIFRLYIESYAVPKSVYIAGTHPQLGNLVPNKIAMYDDGTHHDQRAGDHVWSYSAKFPAGTKLFYVYTNSGKEGKWEGLDVPEVRSFSVEASKGGEEVYRPIESFGKIYMQADPGHTNAAGYELIAKALLEVLKKDEKVKDYLRQVNDRTGQRR